MKTLYCYIIVAMLFVMGGCTNDFEKLNTNPNKITEGENGYLLIGAQITAARKILDDDNQGFGKWVQYFTRDVNSRDAFSRNDDINDYWNYNNLYVDALPNIQAILQNTKEAPHPNYEAVASVMKAWIFNHLVENWGDIPYSKALQGNTPHGEDADYLMPRYDSQEVIYKGLIALLDEANALIATESFPIDPSTDIFCEGNMLLWKKFANTLQARILLNMLEAEPSFAGPKLEAVLNDPVKYPLLEGNEDDIGVTWIGAAVGPYENHVMSSYRSGERTIPASSGILHILSVRKDPRRDVWFDPAKEQAEQGVTVYVGAPPAFDANNPADFTRVSIDSVSQLSVANFGTTNRQEDIITYAELQFIKAEAAWRGLQVGGDVKTFYNEGIAASFSRWDVEDKLTEYLQHPLVDYNQAAVDERLEYIVTQRYLAQFYQSVNTFVLIRRTGLPKLDYFYISTDPSQAAKGFPYRLRYPHVNSNNPNWAAAAEGIELNMWGKKLWWAQHAPAVGTYSDQLQSGLVAWPPY